MNCFELTTSELANLISQGYTLVSGPHASQLICEASCGGGIVCDTCGNCVGGMPQQWTITVSGFGDGGICVSPDPSPQCPNLNGTFVLTYAGNCTWVTSETVDFTSCPDSGPYATSGPAWTLRLQPPALDRWELAMGTTTDATGVNGVIAFDDFNCCGENVFTLGQSFSQSPCTTDNATVVMTPVGNCPSVSNACCGCVPTILFAEVTDNGGSNGCDCLDASPVMMTLTYDSGIDQWFGQALFGTCGVGDIQIWLRCNAGSWEVRFHWTGSPNPDGGCGTIGGGPSDWLAFDTITCIPFVLDGDFGPIINECGCLGDGSIRVTITA